MPLPERLMYDDVMAGRLVSADEILKLARDRWCEGIGHDFKSGRAASAEDNRRLVWTLASFANADGGIVVLGIGEGAKESQPGEPAPKERKERPCEPVRLRDEEAVESWLSSVMRPIAANLHPRPRWSIVSHEGGFLVVIAVPRSEQLVPARNKAGFLGYPLRFGDGAVEAPEYLISDLRLGRRIKPVVELRVTEVRLQPAQDRNSFQWSINFGLENIGLSWVDRAMVVVVFPVLGIKHTPSVPASLLSSVDVQHAFISSVVSYRLLTPDRGGPSLAPFVQVNAHGGDLSAPIPPCGVDKLEPGPNARTWPSNPSGAEDQRFWLERAVARVRLRCGVCLTVEGTSPRWFQLDMEYGTNGVIASVELLPADGRPLITAIEITR